MHPALEVYDLLHLIFRFFSPLPDAEADRRTILLSCALTCKAFSQVALDILWECPQSITVMPFASPSQYEEFLNPGGRDLEAYSNHIERLRFYGKRVQTLRIHSKLTRQLLECLVRLQDTHSSSPDVPSFMATIFPRATTLDVISSGLDIQTNLVTERIRIFLSPTIKQLFLRCPAWPGQHDLEILLGSVVNTKPHLTSINLHLGPSPSPKTDNHSLSPGLSAGVSQLLQLPDLEILDLPLQLLDQSSFIAISGLYHLKQLRLAHPTEMQSKFFNLPSLISDRISFPENSFPNLQDLTIDTQFVHLDDVLYMHPALTSHITHLSLYSVSPLGSNTLKDLFPPLASAALPCLTHLTLGVGSLLLTSDSAKDGVTLRFLEPLLTSPLATHLTNLRFRHGAPLNVTDEEYDTIARSLPNIETLHFEVPVNRGPRMVQITRRRCIRSSLAALISFALHCQKLRAIALTVDAETQPVPELLDDEFTAIETHAVDVDMSISPVGDNLQDLATFFAKLFPDRRSQLTSSGYYAKRLRPFKEMVEVNGVLPADVAAVHSGRWKYVDELARQIRGS
ncbi:hypothetical protein H0H93_008014 [Arthromyces matolae]|nr:hypothetical protein H0H93_008014 [Arthromyces matolae]